MVVPSMGHKGHWACSSAGEHGVRIAETRVRFPPGPPTIRMGHTMARTKKEGKRSHRHVGSNEDPAIKNAIHKRHTFGSTEKILRRNRKIWTRLAAKIRRRLDQKAIEESNR